VIYELDIWRATNLLICAHGAEAELHAAQRVSGAPAADGARCAAKNSCTFESYRSAFPKRIASLTMLSRPHPASFVRALKIDLEQPHRSRHHQELLDPDAGQRLLAENEKWARDRLARNGVPAKPSKSTCW
jgi:hypothetical protein